MVLHGTIGAIQLTISLKPVALNIMFDSAEVFSYDRGGRLWAYFRSGHMFRIGLDGRALEKWREGNDTHRRYLDPQATSDLLDRTSARMRELADQIRSGQVAWNSPYDPSDVLQELDQAGRYSAGACERDRAAYQQIYDPVGILPPDQYMALVLQATTGCSFNTCTFCNFYQGRRFQIKSPDAFREHARAVHAFLGASISIRRSIFLGEANALVAPTRLLLQLFQIAHEEFGPLSIYAFQDGHSGIKKSVDDYRALAEAGLKRVSVGMESGHDPLLQFVRKPSSAAEAIESMTTLKAAGVAVSVIVLLGLGGERYAAGHVADTIATLNALPLDGSDIIYFSDLIDQPGTAYPEQIRAAGIRPLGFSERHAQHQAIRAGLRFGSNGPRLAIYDVHEFIY